MIKYYSSPEGHHVSVTGNVNALADFQIDVQTIEFGMIAICKKLCLETDCSPLTFLSPDGDDVTISCIRFTECDSITDEAARSVSENVNVNARLF